jgi:hypothetical protein
MDRWEFLGGNNLRNAGTPADTTGSFFFKTGGFGRLLIGNPLGGAVVEALRYKPEGRGIDSRWCHWNFSLT